MDEAMQAPIIRCGLAALLSSVCAVSLVAQRTRSFADYPLYEAVLEQQFTLPDSKPPQSRQTLRYIDGDSGEMQVSIVFDPSSNAYRIDRWKLPSGSPSVWRQLVQLSEKASVTLDAAMREIRIERTNGVVSAQSAVGELLSKGPTLQVAVSPLQEFVLHGTNYFIIVESPGRDIRLRVQGPADGERSSDPVVRWMAQVRRTLADADLGSVR